MADSDSRKRTQANGRSAEPSSDRAPSDPSLQRALPPDLLVYGRRASLRREETEARLELWRRRQERSPAAASAGLRRATGPARGAAQDATAAAPCFAVVLAASAGGLQPLIHIVCGLPADLPAAVLVLQHRAPGSRLPELLAAEARVRVRVASDGDVLAPGTVFVPPPRHHARVHADGHLTLWSGPRIDHVCPSVNLALESLATSFGPRAIAVVLSGNGSDGAMGSRAVWRAGGVVLAQRESGAAFPGMPVAAHELGKVDLVLAVEQIASALVQLTAPGLERTLPSP